MIGVTRKLCRGWLIVSLCLLTGCLDEIRYNMPCKVPEQVTAEEVVGVWQIEYHGYDNPDSPSSRISGVETISIYPNGEYSQTFHSTEFSYNGKRQPWLLITNEGDGPKLKLDGLRYFADGLKQSNGPLLLRLQRPDKLLYQESQQRTGVKAVIVVNYPEDGFVYLYPRSCLWEFVLLQMASDSGDPDDLTVHQPVFQKIADHPDMTR